MAEARTTISKPKTRPWRAVGLATVLLGSVALAHAGWGWYADRALTRRIDALRARGQRVLPIDFSPKQTFPMLPNAAVDLRAAAAIVDDESEESASASWGPSTRPVDPRAWPYLERANDWFAPAIHRVERAQAKPMCDWEHRIPSPALDLLLPELNGQRAVHLVLVTSAAVEHRARRDDVVVRRFGQMLYLGDTCARTPAMVGHLVAIGMHGSAAQHIEPVAYELRVGAAAGEAKADDVRKLIAALLDETTLRSGFETGMEGDRMVQLDAIAPRDGDKRLGAVSHYLARPWLDGSGLANLERNTAALDAVRGAPDWPTAKVKLNALPATSPRAFFASFDMQNLARRATETQFVVLTDRRLAATALAIRLYQIDHAGARPQRLDELVPAYLPKVPLDAMAAGARPIQYLPRAAHPVLYSVGRNGADDAADESAMPNEFGEIDEWRRLDRVFYLTGRQREYIYIVRPRRDGEFALVPMNEGRPPWEREGEDPAAAATQPTWPAQPAASSPADPALTPR